MSGRVFLDSMILFVCPSSFFPSRNSIIVPSMNYFIPWAHLWSSSVCNFYPIKYSEQLFDWCVGGSDGRCCRFIGCVLPNLPSFLCVFFGSLDSTDRHDLGGVGTGGEILSYTEAAANFVIQCFLS